MKSAAAKLGLAVVERQRALSQTSATGALPVLAAGAVPVAFPAR